MTAMVWSWSGSDSTFIRYQEVVKMREDDHISRVLVVEDEKGVRDLFCGVVDRCGFTAIEARDGEEAIRMLGEWDDLDAIILDIKMPNANGYQVIEKIREMNKIIPIIMCTAFSELKDAESVITYPKISMMEKPVSLKELEDNLKKVVLNI